MPTELQLLAAAVRRDLTELGIDVLADKLQDLGRDRESALLRRRKRMWVKSMSKTIKGLKLCDYRGLPVTRWETLEMALAAIKKDCQWSMIGYLKRFEKDVQ